LTAYKNNPSASTAVISPAGLIGGDAKFTGKESITVPATASLRLIPAQGFTASAWLRIEQPQQAVVFALSDQGKSLELALDGAKIVARASLGGPPATVTAPSDLTMSAWHHVAITAGAGTLTLYVDGAAVGTAQVTLQELGGAFTIGAAANGRNLTGDVDEVEVSKVARSADWIKTEARGQGIDSNLVIYGADGQKEASGQASYFGIIAKNLTLDGWVVIGICMGMLVIALVIMVWKAFYLSRVESGNGRFLAEFQALGGDPTALDRPVDASGSTAKAVRCIDFVPAVSQWRRRDRETNIRQYVERATRVGIVAASHRCHPRHDGRLHDAFAATPVQSNGASHHCDLRRSVPGTLGHRGRRHDHLCRHRPVRRRERECNRTGYRGGARSDHCRPRGRDSRALRLQLAQLAHQEHLRGQPGVRR
jgi:hypothetical protein